MKILLNNKRYILCPRCGRPTKVKANPNTELKKFPLWCAWCKHESIIDYVPPKTD